MTQADIDSLLLGRALTIAQDPEATVAQMEWVRKFLNDHEHRHRDDGWKPEDPSLTALKQYGHMTFDELPISSRTIDSTVDL